MDTATNYQLEEEKIAIQKEIDARLTGLISEVNANLPNQMPEMEMPEENLPEIQAETYDTQNYNTPEKPEQSIRNTIPAKTYIQNISSNIDEIIQIAYNDGMERGYSYGRKSGMTDLANAIHEFVTQYVEKSLSYQK